MNLSNFLKTAFSFICLCCQLLCASQVCTGSLGDPVVNVTFGSGANPGSPLKVANTTYLFSQFDCPSDGGYTITNKTVGCFSSTWYTLPEDHTPNDINGYMMLVNASFNPGDFYVDTVKNLCASTTYEFAAWIINVLNLSACGGAGIKPNLIFNIETTDGTVLGSYSTGEIASSFTPTWKQYGLFFTTPVNTNSVVIRLTNTAPGGCGNDLALDDITFRPCGPAVTAAIVNNNQTFIDFCKGAANIVPLIATIGNGYNAPAMQWQISKDSGITWTDIAGATSLTYEFRNTAAGIYKYRLTVANGSNITISSCRVASNIVTVTIHDLPAVNATSNSPVCEKQLINLLAMGGVMYVWKGPSGFTDTIAKPSLVAQSNAAGRYDVTVTDQYGCVDSGYADVIINPKPTATISGSWTFCEGDTVALEAGGGISYLWSPAKGLSSATVRYPFAAPVDSTVYSVIVTSPDNCMDTASVALNVLKKPIANAGPDKIILKGQQIIPDAEASGTDIIFSWSPGTFLSDPLLLKPVAKPANDITYTLTVTSNVGCGISTDAMHVKVYNDIYIPNAFSPNNDGLNDTWRIEGLVAAPNAKVRIYNRFGNLIFETTGINEPWDGTYKGEPLAPGAYAYLVDLKNGMPLRKGMVIIVR